jgi:hypothetical protein
MRLAPFLLFAALAGFKPPTLAQSKAGLDADVLFSGIPAGVAPERVLRVTRRVLAGRNFDVVEEKDGTIIGHYVSGSAEVTLHIFLEDDALRFTATDKDDRPSQLPERWRANLRADLKQAIGSLAPAPAGQQTPEPGHNPWGGREVLFVRAPAVLDPAAPVAEAVLRECNVETMVARNATSGIRGKYQGRTQVVRGEAKGRELRLTILEASGVGPGQWVRKAITLRADFIEGSRVLASQTFDHETNLMGGFALRSACTTLGNVSILLGKQIGQWANNAVAGLPATATERLLDVTDRTAADLRVAERLKELEKLRQEGLIDGGEYERKRAEIMRAF